MRTLRSIFRRKLRAALTIFGITIGVLALVVMGSIAEKLSLLVDGGTDYYADKVIVSGSSGMAGFSVEPISTDLIAEIEAVDGVARAAGSIMMLLDAEPSAVSVGIPANINASDFREEGYESFESEVISGRALERDDRDVVVVGADLVSKLDARVGETIEVRGRDFEVIGILGKTLTAPDMAVQMSLADAQELLVADLPAAVAESVDPAALITSIAVYLDEGVDPDEMAEVIAFEVPDVTAMGPSGFEASVKEPLKIFNQIIYAVAIVSLMVGGLSVINTMTMSVAERTREIGVRKAIGATDGAIMRQFIAESAVIGLIGGLLGLGLGSLVAMGGNQAGAASATELFLVTPRLALGSVAFALVLGVLSGLYPAWHAARLNPVQALRYE
ncbi:MAG: ABC transporter permease [Aeromicrobium sp.]|nr:ABC transporter permease [Aeromicrobium sp.]